MNIIEQIKTILDGIDRDETHDEGWWETSKGVQYGTQKLAEVLEAVRPFAESHERLLEMVKYLSELAEDDMGKDISREREAIEQAEKLKTSQGK